MSFISTVTKAFAFTTFATFLFEKPLLERKATAPWQWEGIPGWWNAGGNVCHRKKKQRSRCFFSEGWNQTVWKRDTHKKQCLKDEGPCGMMLRYPPLKERSISKSLQVSQVEWDWDFGAMMCYVLSFFVFRPYSTFGFFWRWHFYKISGRYKYSDHNLGPWSLYIRHEIVLRGSGYLVSGVITPISGLYVP